MTSTRPIRDVSQQLADLPAEVQQKLLQIAVVAVSMSDEERDAALSVLVTRAYWGAARGAADAVALAEMDAACAQVVRLTGPVKDGA